MKINYIFNKVKRHKITIAKDEVRVKIAIGKEEDINIVRDLVNKILNQVKYEGKTIRGDLDLSKSKIVLHTGNKKEIFKIIERF